MCSLAFRALRVETSHDCCTYKYAIIIGRRCEVTVSLPCAPGSFSNEWEGGGCPWTRLIGQVTHDVVRCPLRGGLNELNILRVYKYRRICQMLRAHSSTAHALAHSRTDSLTHSLMGTRVCSLSDFTDENGGKPPKQFSGKQAQTGGRAVHWICDCLVVKVKVMASMVEVRRRVCVWAVVWSIVISYSSACVCVCVCDTVLGRRHTVTSGSMADMVSWLATVVGWRERFWSRNVNRGQPSAMVNEQMNLRRGKRR